MNILLGNLYNRALSASRLASIYPGFPMKLPATIKTVFVFPVALLVFCAPHIICSLVVLAAIPVGMCTFDRLCKSVAIWLRAMIDDKPLKAPANLVSLGVILSVVFVVVGFSWDTTHFSQYRTSLSLLWTVCSVVGQMLSLATFLGILGIWQSSPQLNR